MGSAVHVIVDGPEALADWAMQRIAVLERRWSRFLVDSEVSRLNAAGGAPVVVSVDTARLVDTALAARSITGGACDPFVLGAVEAIGYDRSYEFLEGARGLPGWASSPNSDGSVPSAAWTNHGDDNRESATSLSVERFAIGEHTSVLRLPGGVRLDPGSIGKGLAGDIVAEELCERGARSALVNIGGDIAMSGDRPQGWPVRVDHPISRAEIATVHVIGGGIATSSTLLRTWTHHNAQAHHLLDPSNGESLQVEGGAPVVATAIAASGWEAEAIATWALVTGARDRSPDQSPDQALDQTVVTEPPGSWMVICVDADGIVSRRGAGADRIAALLTDATDEGAAA